MILMKIVNKYDLELKKIDEKYFFLHGNFKETIYIFIRCVY